MCIENAALITQLPFQSKLGKCRVFPVIVAYQFGKDISYVEPFLNFHLHDLSEATLISAKSLQYMTICPRNLPLSFLESWVSFQFSILHFYFHNRLFFQCCHQALKRNF